MINNIHEVARNDNASYDILVLLNSSTVLLHLISLSTDTYLHLIQFLYSLLVSMFCSCIAYDTFGYFHILFDSSYGRV
jgi:hypothetical protein